jgi:hypothetical protein
VLNVNRGGGNITTWTSTSRIYCDKYIQYNNTKYICEEVDKNCAGSSLTTTTKQEWSFLLWKLSQWLVEKC